MARLLPTRMTALLKAPILCSGECRMEEGSLDLFEALYASGMQRIPLPPVLFWRHHQHHIPGTAHPIGGQCITRMCRRP